ncbi:MAG: FAD-binding protein [Prochlorothrix sp.]|nr:FAD-binding protein [Prochlorothrix sp.]
MAFDRSAFVWDPFLADLDGLDVITDRSQRLKLSQDYYHFSPVLQPQLQDVIADVVVRATTEAEVLQVARACVSHGVPLTVRGAGTGNYGQAMPLEGGVVLDLSTMNQILWLRPGLACVEPGVKIAALDREARPLGWEMRMAPSTYRTATIGGFIGGGSGGLGSINYGFLSDRGNLCAVRVVTMEPEPRVLELRGDAVQQVNHAYGTNGIITALEIPLAPAYPWAEVMVSFGDFMAAARFGQRLGDGDGLVKKLVCVCAWPIPNYFAALKRYIPEGQPIALVLIAEQSLELFRELVQESGGKICYEKSALEAEKGVSLAEHSWNHTTLHARSVDPSLTYLQTVFPADPQLKLVEHMYHHFGDEVPMHLEFIRLQGQTIAAGLQLVRYSTPERLQEIIDYHEARGAMIFDPHTYILENAGRKVVDPRHLAFKQEMDPQGLLNPGKMRSWQSKNASLASNSDSTPDSTTPDLAAPSDSDPQPTPQSRWDQADRNWQAAQLLHHQGFYDVAMTRAYYAMFYVVDALLRSQQLFCTSHDERLGLLRHHLVASGEVPPELADHLEFALEERCAADYTSQEMPDQERADRVLGLVPAFLALREEQC